ncbi:MAG: DEAD/DEAH box helicase [Candidatus Krumholzibacteriota bacterium]|nr:DEAD/DEAH box helicase [Candidatus Krumholzibacteriota bacterium]
MSFHELGLSEKVLKGVEAAGYKTPTEIQMLAIPPAVEGRDVTGRAQTGTGKTAAFALPILSRLERSPAPASEEGHGEGRKRPRKPLPPVRALVITPTRELALQIEEAFKEYGKFLGARTLTVYGGVRIDRQINRLRAGVDVVIATPGRLLDHMGRGSIDLSRVEVFVLDEVDRMFDMGFIKDVRRIVAAIPVERQTLLFSATISSQVKLFARRLQTDSVLIEIGDQTNPVETVTQHVYPTARDRKLELLRTILENENMEMVLVFCGRKDHADFVTLWLALAKLGAIES